MFKPKNPLPPGWTYRSAAKALGVHFSHLARVAKGLRPSASLEAKIAKLKPRKEVAK